MKTFSKKVLSFLPALTSVLSIPCWSQAPVAPVTPPAPRADPAGTLDFAGKFHDYATSTFTVGTLAAAAVTAGYRMVNPPDHYPRQWKDGGGAFGRNLGDAAATTGTLLTGKFLAGAVLGEDPRYFPSHSRNAAARLAHALAFTFIDKSDHGTNRLALSSFAGAAAAGFVGEAYLPTGFNDNVHAYQRGFIAFGVLGFGNVVAEFRPELREFGHRLHLVRNP